MTARLVVVGGEAPLTRRLTARLAPARSFAGDPDALFYSGLFGAEPASATLVYLAGDRQGTGEPDLEDAWRVGTAAVAAGVGHVVVVSSAEVWEPSHHHSGHVGEETLGPPRIDYRTVALWRRLETVAAEALGAVPHTVLRPTPVPLAGGRDFASRFFAGRFAHPLPGFDPPLQLLDPDDLADAILRAAEARRPGVFHVAPAGVVRVRRAARLAGQVRVTLPGWLRRPLGRLAGRRRGRDEAARLRHPWTVSGARAARELGFTPRFSSAQTVVRLAARQPAVAGAPVDARAVPDFDDFGMEADYIDAYGRTLLRFLHDLYWRVEIAGMERVPRRGRAVLVGMHRGFMPFDGVMALHALRRETGRIPRFLIHPTLVKFPYLADFMTKLGGIHASRENADRVLGDEGVLAIYPEGIRGAFTPYRRAYRLGKLGRDEFVRMALANRAPIVPFVTVGSAEIFPILGRIRWRWWERFTEWPCLPITPTFPLLPVPLPSKWHTWYLEPLPVEDDWGPEAAADPRRVRAVSREVRRRMEAAIAELLARRRSIFYGSVFDRGHEIHPQETAA